MFQPRRKGCGPDFFHNYHIPTTGTAEQSENARKRTRELEALVRKFEIEKFGLERFSNDSNLISFLHTQVFPAMNC